MSFEVYQQTNFMAHIYQQYQSSCDSLLFVHGIMSVFYKDLISTSHTRKAEINTMTTSSGIALRKVVLDMHNDLANELFMRMQMYSKISNHILAQTQLLNQSIKHAQHCLASYDQTKNFIFTKAQRIDQQVNRLERITAQLQKRAHMNILNQQFIANTSGMKSYMVDTLQYDANNIKIKLQNYQKQQHQVILMQANLSKQEQVMKKLYLEMKQVQENSGNFVIINNVLKQGRINYNKFECENFESNKKAQIFQKRQISESSIKRPEFVMSSNRRQSIRSNHTDTIGTMSQQRDQEMLIR